MAIDVEEWNAKYHQAVMNRHGKSYTVARILFIEELIRAVIADANAHPKREG